MIFNVSLKHSNVRNIMTTYIALISLFWLSCMSFHVLCEWCFFLEDFRTDFTNYFIAFSMDVMSVIFTLWFMSKCSLAASLLTFVEMKTKLNCVNVSNMIADLKLKWEILNIFNSLESFKTHFFGKCFWTVIALLKLNL